MSEPTFDKKGKSDSPLLKAIRALPSSRTPKLFQNRIGDWEKKYPKDKPTGTSRIPYPYSIFLALILLHILSRLITDLAVKKAFYAFFLHERSFLDTMDILASVVDLFSSHKFLPQEVIMEVFGSVKALVGTVSSLIEETEKVVNDFVPQPEFSQIMLGKREPLGKAYIDYVNSVDLPQLQHLLQQNEVLTTPPLP